MTPPPRQVVDPVMLRPPPTPSRAPPPHLRAGTPPSSEVHPQPVAGDHLHSPGRAPRSSGSMPQPARPDDPPRDPFPRPMSEPRQYACASCRRSGQIAQTANSSRRSSSMALAVACRWGAHPPECTADVAVAMEPHPTGCPAREPVRGVALSRRHRRRSTSDADHMRSRPMSSVARDADDRDALIDPRGPTLGHPPFTRRACVRRASRGGWGSRVGLSGGWPPASTRSKSGARRCVRSAPRAR